MEIKQGLYEDARGLPKDPPRLHQSVASVLVNKSPLHGWFKEFGPAEEEPTEATDRGQLCHALLLGGKEIVTVEANDWRTNAAKAQRDEARAAGKFPVLCHKLEEATIMTDNVIQKLIYRGVRLDGRVELTALWRSPGGTLCQGRLDHYKDGIIIDLKFVRNANPEVLGRIMVDYGYDVQIAAYTEAIEQIDPTKAGIVKFVNVFIETDPPHAITLTKPSGDMRALGQWKWSRAKEIWDDCLEKYGTETPWPGYPTEVIDISPPSWALKAEMIKDEIAEGGNL